MYLFIPFMLAVLYQLSVILRPEFVVHGNGIIFISGASTGIGRAAAVKFADLGYTVLAGVRKSKDVEEANSQESKRPTSSAGRIIPVIVDVTKPETLDAVFSKASELAKETGLGVVAVFCNAGIGAASMPVEFRDMDVERKLFEVSSQCNNL